MGLEHHSKPEQMFRQQLENAREYVVPFIEEQTGAVTEKRVLEIGSGEGGVLAAFAEKGAVCMGIELHDSRTQRGKEYSKEFLAKYKMELTTGNIFDKELQSRLKNSFDIIILKDVIEHLPNQSGFLAEMKTFLKKGGVVFFGFPPWRMPFGGHQQIAVSKAGKLPYYHLLPKSVYRFILKNILKEPDATVSELLDVYDTRISINRFEQIVKENNYKIVKRQLYLINPIYKYKFGWKARKQLPLLRSILYFRDFYTTCCYYLVSTVEEK